MAGSETQALRAETATFLFTDIEGSTRLLQQIGDRFTAVLADHHAILTSCVEAHGGTVQRTEGDSFFATFTAATSAVEAAIGMQTRLSEHPWPDGCEVRVRVGLHTGEAVFAGFEIVGLDVHRAARIMSVAWGGQIVVSRATCEPVTTAGAGIEVVDLGEHRLQDLAAAEHLYQVIVPGLRRDFPAIRSLDRVPNNLPTQLTSFVGRDREVAAAATLLAGTRLLTLTGPGGTGKTRLSIQLAASVAAEYPGGVYFVPLAPVRDPALVLSTIERELGLVNATGRDSVQLLAEHLAGRSTLLVLDNFEQVLAAAPDVSKLLGEALGTTIVVSSRAPLRISGEQEYAVPPLTVPEEPGPIDLEVLATKEAVALFVIRATASRPDFELTLENAEAVAEITWRLDGLPLAIELAAARIKLLPPHALASRLANRLDLLSGGSRDRTDRQRTLRGAIDWSYELLDEAGRTMLAHFSVFSGGAEIEQIEAVCGDPSDDVYTGLGEVVDHSLVRRVGGPSSTRFAMLETIREYGAEKLAESGGDAAVRDRHLDAYLDLVERAAPNLTAKGRETWLAALARDHDNIRVALAWAIESGRTEAALRLAAGVWRFWQIRGFLVEGERLLHAVLALPDVLDHTAAHAAAQEAAGGIAYWRSALHEAEEHYLAALAAYEAVGSAPDIARAHYNLAFAYAIDDHDAADASLNRSLEIYEELGDRTGAARVHWGLAVIEQRRLNYDGLIEHATIAADVFRDLPDQHDYGWAIHAIGMGLTGLGRFDEARQAFNEALDLWVASDDRTGLYILMGDFGVLAEIVGEFEYALVLAGITDRLARETGSSLLDSFIDDVFPDRARAAEQVTPERRDFLMELGRTMALDEAIAMVRGGELPEGVESG